MNNGHKIEIYLYGYYGAIDVYITLYMSNM